MPNNVAKVEKRFDCFRDSRWRDLSRVKLEEIKMLLDMIFGLFLGLTLAFYLPRHRQ